MVDLHKIEVCIIAYALIAIPFAITVCSWMINQTNSESWKKDIQKASASGLSVPKILEKSWSQRPIVDVRAFSADALWELRGCPADFPEDVMYDIWQGTRGMCDCLEREGDRNVYVDLQCERGGGGNKDSSKGEHASEDCKDVHGRAPIVQNVVNGVRFCGKLAKRSLSEAVRPVPTKDSKDKRQFVCPQDHIPCNDGFFDRDDIDGNAIGQDYVVCRHKDEKAEDICPITSMAFTMTSSDQSLYEAVRVEDSSGATSQVGIYFSKSVMQHGITQITFGPGQPCFDRLEYNATPTQFIYFGELRRNARKCSRLSNYELMSLDPAFTPTLFDLELESGVGNILDDALHYTYSAWPSSDIKKDIPMYFYQQPIYNYKLSCDTEPGKDMASALQLIRDSPTIKSDIKMFSSFDQLAVVALVVILVTPVAAGKTTFLMTPLAMITVAGILVKPLLLILKTASELNQAADGSESYPDWIEDCIDEGVTFNIESVADDLRNIAKSMEILGALMIIYEVMVALGILVSIIALISANMDSNRMCDNLRNAGKEGVAFIKAYKHLH